MAPVQIARPGWLSATRALARRAGRRNGSRAAATSIGISCARAAALLLAAVGLELAHVGPQVARFLLVLDAREEHLGAGNPGARVLDVFLEGRLAPGDARILVGVAVVVAFGGAGLAAVDAVELRTDLVLRVLADVVAGHALL